MEFLLKIKSLVFNFYKNSESKFPIKRLEKKSG